MEKPGNELQAPSDHSPSIDLLAILNRRKSWLFLSCVLGLGVGAAYYFLSPRRFESRAELLLMQNDPEPMAGGTGIERDVSEELLSTHMKLVQSSRIVQRALNMDVAEAKLKAKVEDRAELSEATESAEQTETSATQEPTPGDASNTEKVTAAASSGEATSVTGTAQPEAVQPQSDANTPQAITPQANTPQANTVPVEANTVPNADPVAIGETAPAAAPVKSTGEAIAGLSPTEAITGVSAGEGAPVEAGGPQSLEVTVDVEESVAQHPLFELPSIVEHLTETTSPTEYVIKNMYVTTGGSGRARNARVLNIAFRHTSPEDCEVVTRAIVDRYQEFVRSKFKDINSDAAALITQANDEIQTRIDKLNEEYKDFRLNKAPLLTRGATGGDIYTTRYEELAAEISQLAIQRDETAGRLEMVRKSLADFTANNAHNLQKLALIDERNAERLGILVTVERGKAETAAFQSTQPERMAGATAEYSALLTLKARLSQLTADFGPEYPEVKAIKQQINEMEKFLTGKQKGLNIGEEVQLTPDDVMNAYVSMLDHDLRALEQRTKDLEKQMVIAEASAKKLVEFQLDDESMLREIERQEQLHDAVIERLRDINMKKDASPLILELIQEPTIPEKVEPKSVIAAAISMLCALLIGGAGVLVAELRDRSVHSPEEFEEMLGSRVLAHLPNFQNDAEIRKLQRVARKNKSPISPSLLTYFAPDSRASETFRALRTQVMFSAGGDHKILVTTSSNQGAGKSMLSSNMAVSMAGLGADVLLVDCDMRLPQVHRLFGVPNDKGLADAIRNPEGIDDLLIPSGVEGLTLLPSGQAPANPAELLSRPECKELLESLRQRYSYVILDCPPVLAVSDPSIVAPMADGVLFVSVVDNESRPKTIRAKRILEGVGAKIIGIVVNRSDESTQRYGYQAYGYESTSSADSYYAARPAR